MSAKLTREQIDELERITDGFTCGEPWEQGSEEWDAQAEWGDGRVLVLAGDPQQVIFDCGQHDCGPEMAAALVAMHNAFPALLQMARQVEALKAENSRLRDALNRDRTGLAAALVEVRKVAAGYRWIPDGEWGSYSWEEHICTTLRKETGWALGSIEDISRKALEASGTLAGQALRGEDHLTGAREVLRTINDTAQECPVCHGARLRVGGEDGVWEEGEIEHRAGCALEREKGE